MADRVDGFKCPGSTMPSQGDCDHNVLARVASKGTGKISRLHYTYVWDSNHLDLKLKMHTCIACVRSGASR